MKNSKSHKKRVLSSVLSLASLTVPMCSELYADANITANMTMTDDYAYSGTVSIADGVTLDLNGFDLGHPTDTATQVTLINGTGTITNTSTDTSLITIVSSKTNDGLAPTIIGNVSVSFSPSGDNITRLKNEANGWTGATYINGGRLHVTSQECIGSGVIYLNGNLVNDNTSGKGNLALNNAIVLTGSQASIRAAYGGSITVSGVISQDPNAKDVRFTIALKENSGNTYNIYGANTYTADTYIGDAQWPNLSHKITIGEQTAFGSGAIYMVTNANLNLGKSGQSYSGFNLANPIHLNNRTLNITNNTGSALTLSGAVDSKNTSGNVVSGGTLKINGNGKNFTLSAPFTGNMTLDLTNTGSQTGYINSSFTGDIDTIYRSGGKTVYYRHNIKNQQNTGDTWVYGGNNTRLHVSYGSGLGSGTIYLDGNLCNNSQSSRRLSFDQDIMINGSTASFRVAYKNDDSKASMRLNGVIASDPAKDGSHRLTFNANESSPGMIFLYGENTFTCDSYTNSGCTTELTLGTDTALGNPLESVFHPAGHTRICLETNTADAVRTLANDIIVGNGKTVRFSNASTTWASNTEDSSWSQAGGLGSVRITSDITGTNTSVVRFGASNAALNTGSITYSGTVGTAETPINSSIIEPGVDFTSDHAQFYGNLTSAADAKLTVDGGLSVSGDLKLSKDITLIVDDFENNFTLVDVLETLTIPADAMIELTATEPAVDPTNDILLFSANAIVDETGNILTTETLLSMIEIDTLIFPQDAGWNYTLDATASGIWLKADPNAVPEPSAFILLVLGLGTLAWTRRPRTQTDAQA